MNGSIRYYAFAGHSRSPWLYKKPLSDSQSRPMPFSYYGPARDYSHKKCSFKNGYVITV